MLIYFYLYTFYIVFHTSLASLTGLSLKACNIILIEIVPCQIGTIIIMLYFINRNYLKKL